MFQRYRAAIKGRPSARVAPTDRPVASGRLKVDRMDQRVSMAGAAGKVGPGSLWDRRRSLLRQRIEIESDVDVPQYVTSIIRHALKVTSAQMDLTSRLPERLPPGALEPSEQDQDSHGLGSDRMSQLELDQLQERLKQAYIKDAGFSEEAAKVAEEEGKKVSAFRRYLRSIKPQRRSVTTKKWLKDTAGKTVSAEGEPTAELNPECPDAKVPRTSAPITFGKADSVHIIPAREIEEPLQPEPQQPKEVEVAVSTRCSCFSSFLRLLR